MNLGKKALLFLLLFLAADASAVSAQYHRSQGRFLAPSRGRELQSELIKLYPLFRSNPRKAAVEVSKLLVRYPEEKRLLLEKLGQAYAASGEPDSAIAAYEKCIAIEPINLVAAGDLARLYIIHGRKEEADSLFERILARSGSKLSAFRTIARALMEAGLNSEALATFRRARTELDDPGVFAVELGDLEKLMGDMPAALMEYLNYVRDGGNVGTAREKIFALVENPKSDALKLIASLEEEGGKGDVSYRRKVLSILSAVYLERGLLEKAVETALAADRMDPSSDGRPLLELVERLSDAYSEARGRSRFELFDVALRAAEAYLSIHPRTGDAPRVYLAKASLLADLGLGRIPYATSPDRRRAVEEALETAEFVLQHYPVSYYPEKAALLKGGILFHAGRREEALELYRSAESWALDHPEEFAARISEALIALGREEEAKGYCSSLMQSENGDMRETGRYYLGLVHALAGEHQAARDTLTSLAESNPASPYTNDAIDLAWVIEEGLRKDPDILSLYLSSLEAEVSEDTAGVLAVLERFADMPEGVPLRPRALKRLGSWYVAMGEYERAVSTYEDFLASYPENPLAPEVEHLLGNVYHYWLDEEEPALKRYEHVLMAYPGYIFMDEVRKDVARLRSPGSER